MSSIYLFRVGRFGMHRGQNSPFWEQNKWGWKCAFFLNLRVNWILLTQGLSDPILGCLRSFSPHDSQPRVDHVPLILLKLKKIAFNRKHASLGWFLHVWNLLPPFYFTPWKRILKIGGNSTLYQVKHRLYVYIISTEIVQMVLGLKSFLS